MREREVIRRAKQIKCPLEFMEFFWPKLSLAEYERDIVIAIRETPEVFVTAGNKLGKDFILGHQIPCAFIRPDLFLKHPDDDPPPPTSPSGEWSVKIVTTSVKDDHLDDLWGEIGRALRTSQYPLLSDRGGTLLSLHRELWKVGPSGRWTDSYVKAEVAKKGEARAGHHADFTELAGDESSGLENDVYSFAQGWAKRMVFIGNPNPCDNFYRQAIESGDLPLTRRAA